MDIYTWKPFGVEAITSTSSNVSAERIDEIVISPASVSYTYCGCDFLFPDDFDEKEQLKIEFDVEYDGDPFEWEFSFCGFAKKGMYTHSPIKTTITGAGHYVVEGQNPGSLYARSVVGSTSASVHVLPTKSFTIKNIKFFYYDKVGENISVVPSNPRRNIDIKIKNIVTLPTPIYELPETTFTGAVGQQISSGYRLLQPTSSASSVNLADWTLFINITVNNCTSNSTWLYEDGAWIGSSSTTYVNIQGGQCNTGKMILNDGHNDLVTGTSGVGKVALRRKLGNAYVQYSTDGKTWVDIVALYIPNLIDRTAKKLTFGGKADSSAVSLGKGTISAKLWNSALDDISSLFK